MLRSDRLQADLRRQMVAAGREATGTDRAALASAAQTVLKLRRRLRLGTYREALVLDSKPRFILAFAAGGFEFADGTACEQIVLKVYALPHPGEGRLQALWRERGLPVPRCSSGRTANFDWLVLERLSGWRISPTSRRERLALTERISSFGPPMHDRELRQPVRLRALTDTILPRFLTACRALESANHDLNPAWAHRAAVTYASGQAGPLHGDLAVENIFCTADQSLYLLDASALLGDPSFDAARWAARLASDQCRPEEILDHWLINERFSDPELTMKMLAVECILEAGSREITKAETGIKPSASGRTTAGLIAAANRAWSWEL